MSVEPKRHVPTLSLNLALEAKFPDPFGATFSCPIILIVRDNLNTRFYFVAIMSFSFISLKKVRTKKKRGNHLPGYFLSMETQRHQSVEEVNES